MARTAPTPSTYRTKTPALLLPGPHPRWWPWVTLVGLALGVKVAIVMAALLAAGPTIDPGGTVLLQWRQWDAHHYLYLAGHGYATAGDARNLIAFFPLYPAAIAVFGLFGIPLAVGALVIANLGSLAATVLLYEIALLDADGPAAWRAAALFSLFPTAYFLFAGYTEGLFCALAFGSVLAARHQRWTPAGVLGGLAAASRLTGIALLPFLVLEIPWFRLSRREVWRAVSAAALVPVGLVSYLGVNLWVLHDPLAFVAVQRDHWYHRLTAPWDGATEAVRWLSNRNPWLRLTVGAGELAGAATAYAVSVLSWLRLRPSDAVYALAVTAMATFLPFWLSIPRYLLAMYPLFILAGRVRTPCIQGLAAALSVTALVVLTLAFTHGMWAF